MPDLTLIHHAARRQHAHPLNSLSALRACLEAGAHIVELDITPLLDEDFALLHDAQLESLTDGSGFTFATRAEELRECHHVGAGSVTAEPVGLLSQAVALIQEHATLDELQLDLKPHAPLTRSVLDRLVGLLRPVENRVRVTSIADWSLRRLHEIAPHLALGFDPLLYLDIKGANRRSQRLPPHRVGAYGYLDDHPLASRLNRAAPDYLAARADALAAQVPQEVAWYIRAELLVQALEDGFDWIAYLHARDSAVAAWTLQPESPADLRRAQVLAAAGIDRITTDDAPRLAAALDVPVIV
jgi:glycerophosphoryl diester phosphodiesterase